ncbi:MAG: phosphate/phosphite/phosphonate ABC transporter substrate-binding protein [Candidatus Velthaea sp.]
MSRFLPPLLCAFALSATPSLPASAQAQPATAAGCPNGGTVRFGLEPFEAASRLLPAYDALTKLVSAKLGCPVELLITTSYNAEIEAMRNGKLDVAEFGPLGYVLAHQVAHADAVATYGDDTGKPIAYYASIVSWRGSGITSLKDIANHSFAYSDPASTSGHLFPAYGLRTHGIDPDHGIRPMYAGSHTASFEAIRNKKVDAGELNSNEVDSATEAGEYTPADWVTLWKSDPIPNDAIAVRRDLPDAFKLRFAQVMQALPFSELPPDVVKVFPATKTTRFVPMPDAAYDGIRDLVKTLNVDLTKLS